MSIKNTKLTRFLDVSESELDSDNRTVTLAFSSEQPYQRSFGMEVLDHSPSSVDLTRLNDGAPLLVDHDTTDHVGVIEKASIDGDKVGRVKVRFGNSARAKEVYNDVQEGIRRHVSVGYQILDYELDSTARSGELETFRVTKWIPYEVSIVSVPADHTVGVGRSFINSKENNQMIDQVEQSKRDKETSRIKSLVEMGRAYNKPNLAREIIDNGGSERDLADAILEQQERGNTALKAEIPEFGTSNSQSRNEPKYSLINVIRSLAGDRNVDIGYETEVNQEVQHQKGLKSRGFSIPMQALTTRAAVNAGSIGSSLVESVYMPNMMVDFLRNKSVVINAGATSIPVNAGGDLIIPRQTGTATATWLDLDGVDAITESNQTFDQVDLKMKTLTAMSSYTHTMLKQGLPDIESIIVNDLAQLFATEVDRSALNGSAGNAKEPTGILNQTGIGSLTTSSLTFPNLVNMEGDIADNNVDTNGLYYLTTPTLGTQMKFTEKAASTGQFIWTDNGSGEGMVNGYGAAYTKNMPADTVLLGQFSDLMMAYWGSIDIEVDPYGDNFKKGNVSVRAMLDMDINVRRPDSFCKLAITA